MTFRTGSDGADHGPPLPHVPGVRGTPPLRWPGGEDGIWVIRSREKPLVPFLSMWD